MFLNDITKCQIENILTYIVKISHHSLFDKLNKLIVTKIIFDFFFIIFLWPNI